MSNKQIFAKIVILKNKTWAVLKKIDIGSSKTQFCVYAPSSKGDRTAKKLFESDAQAMYWKFYLPSASELKMSEDVEVALENDKKDWGMTEFGSGEDSFNAVKKVIINQLEIKSLLDKAFVQEEVLLRKIIEKAYPEVSEATYMKTGWFVK